MRLQLHPRLNRFHKAVVAAGTAAITGQRTIRKTESETRPVRRRREAPAAVTFSSSRRFTARPDVESTLPSASRTTLECGAKQVHRLVTTTTAAGRRPDSIWDLASCSA